MARKWHEDPPGTRQFVSARRGRGVFDFDAAFYGSLAGTHTNGPIVSVAPTQ
jgi:hypothetical protein